MYQDTGARAGSGQFLCPGGRTGSTGKPAETALALGPADLNLADGRARSEGMNINTLVTKSL